MKFQCIILTAIVAAGLTLLPNRGLAGEKRTKVIDFEDEVVEGMNKRPLDSLEQISSRDKKRDRPHLYRKRAGFRTETHETVVEMRYSQ
jgi:hypothetical protein